MTSAKIRLYFLKGVRRYPLGSWKFRENPEIIRGHSNFFPGSKKSRQPNLWRPSSLPLCDDSPFELKKNNKKKERKMVCRFWNEQRNSSNQTGADVSWPRGHIVYLHGIEAERNIRVHRMLMQSNSSHIVSWVLLGYRSCISRHLMNHKECFFCKTVVDELENFNTESGAKKSEKDPRS